MSESLLVVETFITTTLCCIEFAEACFIKNFENPLFFMSTLLRKLTSVIDNLTCISYKKQELLFFKAIHVD